MSASQELEKNATNYALEAVRLDKQGSRGMAITMYQKAIESLLKLVQLYPEYNLNKVYIQRAMAYQERIKIIQGGLPIQPEEDGEGRPTEPSPPGAGTSEEKKASFEELVTKEKPDVKWGEVVGLDTAKKAIKEAIVYPVQRPDLFPLGWPRGILLFGPSASLLLSQVSSSTSKQLAYSDLDTSATENQSPTKGNDHADPARNSTNQTSPRKQVPK